MSLDLKRIDVFSAHCRSCTTCNRSRYAYIDCDAGKRLAREAMTPSAFGRDRAK